MKDISDFSVIVPDLCHKFMKAYLRMTTIRTTFEPPNTLTHLTQYIDSDYALVYSKKRIYIRRRIVGKKIVAYAKPNDIHALSRLLCKYLEIKENDFLKEE